MMNHYLIGCGGVGSLMAAPLKMLIHPTHSLMLVDGDTLEMRNLNRQMFSRDEVGMNKAEALAKRINCQYEPRYYSFGWQTHSPSDWLLCVVDNHACRRDVLSVADRYQCSAIFGANEKFSSEAFIYLPEWRDTPQDPRVYYPEILSDRSGDPRSAMIGCTGEAQERTPQLVSANFMAASLVLHLYVLWAMEAPKLKRSTRAVLPYKLCNNLTRMEVHRPAVKTETAP